jgi:predicted nucleic acid-binding protein
MAARNRRSTGETSPNPKAAARLILDSGAIIALAANNVKVRALVSAAIRAGARVMVPAVVVAETFRGRGPRDARVNRALAAADSYLVTDEPAARTAGALLGAARSREAIDALVVAAAIHAGGGRILTADPSDLRSLSAGRADVVIHAI